MSSEVGDLYCVERTCTMTEVVCEESFADSCAADCDRPKPVNMREKYSQRDSNLILRIRAISRAGVHVQK